MGRYKAMSGKDRAALLVARAVALKQLPSPRGLRCVDCGGEAIEYEHRDYNRPLDVQPVCRRCNLHRGPAVPRVGELAAVVGRGCMPYRLRRSAWKLLQTMGLPTDILQDMPPKLDLSHWHQIVPLIKRAEQVLDTRKAA